VPPQYASKIRQPCQVVNKVPLVRKKKEWTNRSLEEVMEAIERGTHSLRKENRFWNIPLSSLSNHLNGKTRSKKMGLACVLTKEDVVTIITWVLGMQ
jgi:hypothetical protein